MSKRQILQENVSGIKCCIDCGCPIFLIKLTCDPAADKESTKYVTYCCKDEEHWNFAYHTVKTVKEMKKLKKYLKDNY